MLKSTYSENCICARRSLSTIWTEVAVLIGSAFILSLAFPGFIFPEGLGFIAFFALIPVFAVIDNTSWKLTPFYGFLFGFTFYLFFNYWLKTFHALAIILVPVIKGAEMLLMFPCLKAASKWFGKRLGHWVQALIWVAYAYMSQSWFAGYPYGTICYALYKYYILIQVADLTGIWFIIF
ncbi:MAG: apolipoprotein N-acyltransferase, partial [Sphaerochaetaceae bacterium]